MVFYYCKKFIITFNLLKIIIMIQFYCDNMKKLIEFIKENFWFVLKYGISSGLSFALDQGLFYVFTKIVFQGLSDIFIIISTILARALSSLFNYFVNKNVVFESKEKDKTEIYKYYGLVIINTIVSFSLVYILKKITNIDPSLIKLPIDILIFIANYFIQKKYIFKKEL